MERPFGPGIGHLTTPREPHTPETHPGAPWHGDRTSAPRVANSWGLGPLVRKMKKPPRSLETLFLPIDVPMVPPQEDGQKANCA